MLLFISNQLLQSPVYTYISKHRMLLFISDARLLNLRSAYFKTSYVTVYPKEGRSIVGRSAFQNIVCYCLSNFHRANCKFLNISKHRMLLFILICLQRVPKKVYFKTSYVTVYLNTVNSIMASVQFQNIVCYCLSCFGVLCVIASHEFQNIVCYCLSCVR